MAIWLCGYVAKASWVTTRNRGIQAIGSWAGQILEYRLFAAGPRRIALGFHEHRFVYKEDRSNYGALSYEFSMGSMGSMGSTGSCKLSRVPMGAWGLGSFN